MNRFKVFSNKLNIYAAKARDTIITLFQMKRRTLRSQSLEPWSPIFEKISASQSSCKVGDFLEQINLNIAASTGDINQIDLAADSCPPVFEAIKTLANTSSQKVFLYHADQKEWKDLSQKSFSDYMMKATSSGCVELAVVCPRGVLVGRYSIALWRQTATYFHTPGNTAPIKRVRRAGRHLMPRAKVRTSSEAVDAVYTWVNSSDPSWRKLYGLHAGQPLPDADRYGQTDELRYSLRSLESYAPWVSNIFIFSNCEPPDWFKPNERFKWIMHDDVIPEEYLPTFNSHAIETFLHNIPGLSEDFLYFNDDFFLADFVRRSDFFTNYGKSVSRLEPYGAVPYLAELCAAKEAEEWQHAAVNGADLIFERFAQRPRQLHRHAPYAFKKSAFDMMVQLWGDDLHRTRAAKFRSTHDISAASFMYHHYALITGTAVESNDDSMIVRHTNYQSFLSKQTYKRGKFYCINDGGGSSANVGFKKFKQNFLRNRYPFKTAAERDS